MSRHARYGCEVAQPRLLDYFKSGGGGEPHINIRWSDDGSDENERVYRYRLDCGLIVSARGTPQPSGDPLVHFPKKMVFRWVAL